MKAKQILSDLPRIVGITFLTVMILLTPAGLLVNSNAIAQTKPSEDDRASAGPFHVADGGNPVRSTDGDPANTDAVIRSDTHREAPPRGIGMSAIHFEYEQDGIGRKVEDQAESESPGSPGTVMEKALRILPTLQGGY